MTPEAKLTLTLPGTPDATYAARHVARAFEAYLEECRAADLSLLVSELVSNGVRHSGAPESSIDLELEVQDGTLRAEVTDPGEGFDPVVPEVPDNSEPGGWGLYLLDRLADRWGVVADDGTTVWFEFDRGEPRPARHARSGEVRFGAPN